MTDDETISDTSSQLSLLKRLANGFLRVILWLIVIAAVIGALVYLYYMYQKYKELTYMTSDECSRYDYQTQICETDNGSLYLRRIEIDKNRMSISDIADDPAWDSHRYGYEIFWFEPCEEGVEIETGKSWSDGEPVILTCHTKSSPYLSKRPLSRLQVSYTAAVQDIVNFDSNGFSIRHDYSDTDYSPLLRKHALTSTEIKRKRKVRLEKAAEEKRIQLTEDAKKEEARRKKIIKEELALKASCEKEIKNRVTDLSEAEHTILNSRDNKNVLDFYCQADDGRQNPFKRNTCTDWRYIINNPTNIEIESLVLRYGIICGHIPKYEKIINTSIPPTKSIAGSVSLESNDGCAKITAVKFKSSESPIKECDRR